MRVEPPELTVARAQPADLDVVVALMEDAGQWLERRGIQQWSATVWKPQRERIAEGITAGDTYLALIDGAVVGTLQLIWEDAAVWGQRPPDAGYVHGLAVRRAYAGRGIGAALLRWAAREIAAAGRQYLRLDCVSSNAALCDYYRRVGFADRGVVGNDRWSVQRWERSVTEDL